MSNKLETKIEYLLSGNRIWDVRKGIPTLPNETYVILLRELSSIFGRAGILLLSPKRDMCTATLVAEEISSFTYRSSMYVEGATPFIRVKSSVVKGRFYVFVVCFFRLIAHRRQPPHQTVLDESQVLAASLHTCVRLVSPFFIHSTTSVANVDMSWISNFPSDIVYNMDEIACR